MEDKRLTEKERLFAEKWHGLIYSFLHENNLTENEYYDVAALGYLRAVTRYSREPKLREYSFSTIAWQAMRSAVGNKKKSDKIRNAFIAYSLNELTDEGTEYGEFIEASRDGFKELAYTEDMRDLIMAIMPQPFNNAVMTNGGANLLTRAQAGEIKIEFTRIVVGNGSYTAEEKTLAKLQQATKLKAQKNSYALSDIDVFSDHSVKVTALITNQDPVTKATLVTAGYYINEIGLYAKPSGGASSTEVLYSIAVTAGTNGDFMPPYNGYNPAQITQDYFATVNNSAQVTINTAGAALLAEDANKLRDDTTKMKCKIGIDNGLIYVQAISE